MTLVYALLGAHFIADFVCQSDWMAINKSKRWDALGVHVAVYMLALWVITTGAMVAFGHGGETIPDLWFWLGLNAVAHFVQDAITSRINARLWQANERHWFFVGIGADQLLHYVTLFTTADWLLR